MPSPNRTVALLIASLAAAFYAWVFLSQPLVEGNQDFTRGYFLLTTLVYPEGLISTWSDGSRLPLTFLDRWPIVAGTLVWLAMATAMGWPWVNALLQGHSLRGSSDSACDRVVRFAYASLVGAALLSTITLAVGLAGALSSAWPLVMCIAVAILISWIAGAWFSRTVASAEDGTDSNAGSLSNVPSVTYESLPGSSGLLDRALWTVTMGLTLWLGAVIMLGAWVPPSEFDVVEYHLQAPKEFFQNGAIRFVPHNIYANMPLGSEMHALAAMTITQQPDAWLGGLMGKSITAALSILGAVLLGGWIGERYGGRHGWVAAGLWLATPGIAHVATQGLIDGVLATYILATALATWQWQTCRYLKNRHAMSLTLGLLAGTCAAIKYPGLIFGTLPCLVICVTAWVRSQQLNSTKQWAPMSLILLVIGVSMTGAPWYAKNWVQAGNPVYPLAASALGGQTLTADKIAQWQQAHRVPPSAPAAAPLSTRVSQSVRRLVDDVLRIVLTSSFVQPSMILGLVAAGFGLFAMRRRAASMKKKHDVTCEWNWGWLMLGWSLWILMVWWLATHRIDRFWLPIIGLWAGLAAWGIWRLRERNPWLVHTLVLLGLFYGALVNSSPVIGDNRYFVSLAGLRDDVGDKDHVPRVAPVMAWINEHLTEPDVRVLLIGEARVFEYRVPVLYSTCFDTNLGEPLLRDRTAEEQLQALKRAGISHVLINWTEIERYRSPGNYGFSPWPQMADIDRLVSDGVLEPIEWDQGNAGTKLFKVR